MSVPASQFFRLLIDHLHKRRLCARRPFRDSRRRIIGRRQQHGSPQIFQVKLIFFLKPETPVFCIRRSLRYSYNLVSVCIFHGNGRSKHLCRACIITALVHILIVQNLLIIHTHDDGSLRNQVFNLRPVIHGKPNGFACIRRTFHTRRNKNPPRRIRTVLPFRRKSNFHLFRIPGTDSYRRTRDPLFILCVILLDFHTAASCRSNLNRL